MNGISSQSSATSIALNPSALLTTTAPLNYGGFFKLAETNKELSGVGLLEAPRIKTMCADILQAIRDYGAELKALDSSSPDHATELEQRREHAIKRVASIIPHHCGDHGNCGEMCKYRELERRFVDKYSTEFPVDKGRAGLPRSCSVERDSPNT